MKTASSSRIRRGAVWVSLSMAAGSAGAQETIFDQGSIKWADVVTDDAAGTVAAAGKLGIAGDAVAAVENVRGLIMSLKGLSSNGSKGTLALGITPARTSFTPMNLSSYAGGTGFARYGNRLLGSTTLGYAQGNATIGDGTYERRAVSVETSLYLRDEDDPVLAVAKAMSTCDHLRPVKPVAPAALAPAVAAAAADSTGAVRPAEVAGTEVKQRAAACTKRALDGLRWNRSIASMSIARGWIRNADGSSTQHSMGTTLNVGLVYGFNPGVKPLSDGAAVTVAYRFTRGEPLLASLADAEPSFKNTRLAMLRLTGGSSTARFHVEGSTQRGAGLTEGSRAFKRAIGLDMRVAEDMWLNIRAGRQRSIDGSRNETGSMLSLSYSPRALLQKVGSASN
jgi:hypothetical protein